MKIPRILLTALFALVLSTAAFAQTVKNPSVITFTASIDHALITSYEVDIVSSTNVVLQTINIGKPAPDASNVCTAALNVQPIAFGTYTLVAHSIAGTVKGENSLPSPAWDRSPGAPTKVNVR